MAKGYSRSTIISMLESLTNIVTWLTMLNRYLPSSPISIVKGCHVSALGCEDFLHRTAMSASSWRLAQASADLGSAAQSPAWLSHERLPKIAGEIENRWGRWDLTWVKPQEWGKVGISPIPSMGGMCLHKQRKWMKLRMSSYRCENLWRMGMDENGQVTTALLGTSSLMCLTTIAPSDSETCLYDPTWVCLKI